MSLSPRINFGTPVQTNENESVLIQKEIKFIKNDINFKSERIWTLDTKIRKYDEEINEVWKKWLSARIQCIKTSETRSEMQRKHEPIYQSEMQRKVNAYTKQIEAIEDARDQLQSEKVNLMLGVEGLGKRLQQLEAQ